MPTTLVTDAQLKRIAARAKGATRGPWFIWKDHAGVYAGSAIVNTPGELRGKYKEVCECDSFGSSDLSDAQVKRNAAYIATVDPDTVAALVAEVQELRAKVTSGDSQKEGHE